MFLAYESREWLESFTQALPSEESPAAAVRVRAAGSGWLVRAAPDGVGVERAATETPAPAGLDGAPDTVLLWLWRRADSGVTREGDLAEVDRLHELLRVATQ